MEASYPLCCNTCFHGETMANGKVWCKGPEQWTDDAGIALVREHIGSGACGEWTPDTDLQDDEETTP